MFKLVSYVFRLCISGLFLLALLPAVSFSSPAKVINICAEAADPFSVLYLCGLPDDPSSCSQPFSAGVTSGVFTAALNVKRDTQAKIYLCLWSQSSPSAPLCNRKWVLITNQPGLYKIDGYEATGLTASFVTGTCN